MRHSHLLALTLAAATSACMRTGRAPVGEITASVTMRSSGGTDLGTLHLVQVADVVRISGALQGIPAGAHGIHFHEVGRCDAPDFTTAGGHFNPGGMKHGLVNAEGPHAGDLPAIAADFNGRAVVDALTMRVSLRPSEPIGVFDADGTALVLHAASDDQRTDPSGNSGARIACGVVQRRP